VNDIYWHPEVETASRADLQRLQQERLRATVIQAAKSPFYRERFRRLGIAAEQVRTLDDLRRFGFTVKQDLRETYPYGMLAVSRDEVVRVHVSSGTTGTPTAVFHTQRDIDRWTDIMARCMYMVGMRKHDVMQNMMTYGMFTGGLGVHYGAERLGMMVLPTSAGNTERQIRLMRDFGTTALHITPTYALHLIGVLAGMGIDPKSLRIKYAIIGGEPCSPTARKKLEQAFGFRTVNCFGLSEMNGPGVGFECPTDGALHLWEDHFIVEIIDPETGEVLPDGREGELVMTTLCREAMPLLRYRTRDLTRIIPEKCRCGRTHVRIEPIKARSDDMLILGGVNVYPSQVEQVLMAFPEVGNNWVMVLTRKESLDRMTIRVEIKPEAFTGDLKQLQALRDRIAHAVKGEILINPQVELLEPGSLPEMVGKAKRVMDQRETGE
jgi:phenylacetate-CoA ligase